MDRDIDLSGLSLANVGLKCRRANRKTLRFLKTTDCREIAEIGVYRGRTSIGIARYLNGRGVLRLFDFKTRVAFVKKRLAAAGFKNVRAYGCTSKLLDSYNWPLMKLLQINQQPILITCSSIEATPGQSTDSLSYWLTDFCDPVDMSTLTTITGQSRPQNHATLSLSHISRTCTRRSKLNPAQVKLIVDILVRRDSRYREVVPNKIFQKVGGTG